ncbi:phosphate regulon sensor histidine kinase PhoR [Aliiglaciecola lipolytica]|uniref:Phosphate regulon sensor protein PhoR n=1 Tax=Aliiglaciecola lipolytica E3 TaxID=1127673 RepID=K6YB26_9ALTE|nr:phosphate regulon sensor histidine kinase PhoR [Aliiglaciecola lipolytica]GAC15382.1 two-component system, OmpR family, phosphate regulon sensor histidine kinase PhoR [Aliiglaciecola lipolytica E3]
MYYPFSWLKNLLRICGFYVIVILVGLYFDALAVAIAFGSTWLLGFYSWHMYRFNRWVWHSKKMTPPKATGFWEHVYEGVYYIQRRNRRKRKELTRMVKRFREGSEALPDATVVVDSNACIVWCNRLARIELGLRWPQDSGRRVDNLIRHPKFIEYFHSGKYDYPVEVPSPSNVQKIFEYRIMPYGEKHLLLIARDVTRLTQLEQMRKDFVANVSHELRTPLTVLNGYLEMLPSTENVPPAFMKKAFNEMRSQSERMQNLVEELLVLSRIEASSERVFEKSVNVPQMLAAIQVEANTLNKDKNHQIIFDIDTSLRVYGIETELRSAFSNLIFNAINYTPAPGIIHVTWNKQNEQAHFSVKDNGEGIPEKHLNRLTERFYRVDKARSRKTGGSGLGLSIVKHVLTHHNSKLDIISEMGVGSEFSFSFSSELSVQSSATGALEKQL